MTKLHGPVYLAAVLWALCLATGLGQESGSSGPSPQFGTKDRILYHVGFSDFSPSSNLTPYGSYGSYGDRYSASSGAVFYSIPHLPSGALLASLELDYCDTNFGNHVVLEFDLCDFLGQNCPVTRYLTSAPTGCGFISISLADLFYALDNNTSEIVLKATLNSGDTTNRLLGAYIGYKLQVSPAPGVATFSDVPTTSPQFKFVEALVAAGITAGCGGGNYCPDQPITRGQMAVFLASALGLHWPN